ncbi:MAG: SDR family NAD(P)-dependent oxidoreductase [Verrucomicrobia bacterium]|nr:SDR family NAD(P)-dependent oxidoreductase [Verrucomicrobiota bacterium]
MFTGQGPQWWGMGRELLESSPVFREKIEECDSLFWKWGGWSLIEELSRDEHSSRMDRTEIAQPAIFALQVGLAAWWREHGILPDALIGHSVGEAASAHLCGALDLPSAAEVIFHRGRTMQAVPPLGRMLAVALSSEEVRPWVAGLGGVIDLAAVNSPRSVTLSGEQGSLEKAAKRLEEAGVWCRFLKVHHAFHSSLMDPVEQDLLKALSGIVSGTPTCPVVSTVSGSGGRDILFDARYWWRNVRQPVLFWQGISALAETGITDFLEIGPHPALSGSVMECLRELKSTGSVIPSLRRGAPEKKTLLESLAALHVKGFFVRQGGSRRPVSLPRHSWRKERLWQESPESAATRLGATPHPLLGRSADASFPLWNSLIDTATLPYLEDHQLNFRTVFPASAYLEMALAAAREIHGNARLVLENVSFQRALFLPETGRRLELSFDCDPEGGAFRITSRPGAEYSWTTHCAGVLRDDTGTRLPIPLSAERIRITCSEEWTGEDSYESFRSSGFHFGESFRRLGRISRRNGEALGEITPFPGLDTKSYVVHPALLDACFQVILSAMDPVQNKRRLFLPSNVAHIRFFTPASERLWSHAVLTSVSDRSVTANISVYDNQGHPVLQLEGFHCVAVDSPNAGGSENDACFYRTDWREAELSADMVRELNASWVVCGEESSPAGRTAYSLSAFGEQCRTSIFGEIPVPATGAGAIHHVVWIPTRGTGGAGDSLRLCSKLLSLVRALTLPDHMVRLTIVTREAQPVGGREMSPSMGALVGLARVVMNEHPALRCRVIDMEGDSDSWDHGALLRELTLGGEEEVALRTAHRFLPHIVRFAPKRALRKGKDLPYRLEADRPGVLDHLSFVSTVRRAPCDGEIEVEVRAAGLNFRDVMKALGIYPVEDDSDLLLGDECSGRVVALGRGVTHLNEGDEVLLLAPGSFARYLTVNSALAFRKPPFLSMEEAATLPVAFLTAKYALEYLARVSPGEKVLIHAAAGGVGLAALQVALRAGAVVFATAGTDNKRALVSQMGATHVMDSRTLDFADEVMRVTGGRGVDVVLNSLSGAAIGKGLSVLAPYGRFLEIGKRDIYRNSRIGLHPFSRSLSYHSIDLSRLMKDRPEFVAGMLGKLMEEFGNGEFSPLPVTTWPLEMAVEAFREMAQGRHQGKIAFSFPEEGVPARHREEEGLRFRTDATYLITGGVGGFGMAIAEWMIRKGAAHLVLLGAGRISTDAARNHFRDSGVDVRAEEVDVSDKRALSGLFSRIRESMPPLGGVIHGAVKWEDAVLQKLTESQLSAALDAKAEGAWNLHEALSGTPLDFFVMISSVSALVGNPGQGAYSAANAFLDALAHHRRWKGLPALTINWGHLGEVGYAARHEKVSDHLDRHGFTPIPMSRALAMLEKLMLSDAVQPAAMIVDWERWAESNPRLRKVSRYNDVITSDTSTSRAEGNPLADAIGKASGAGRTALLGEFVREVCARVLGVSSSNLDPNRPLHEMGLDSLMGIELINRIEAGLKIQFPAGRITGSPTIGMFVSILEDCLAEKGKSPQA